MYKLQKPTKSRLSVGKNADVARKTACSTKRPKPTSSRSRLGEVEGHYIAGTADGFYEFDNPNGLRKDTTVSLARIGFVF